MVRQPRYWERWDDPGVAVHIDRFWRSTGPELEHRRRLVDLVASVRDTGDRILEVGCGTGLVYEALADRLADDLPYTGIDTSQCMLEIARAAHPGVDFRHGDAFALQFGDRSFEIVTCFEVLGHLPDVARPLSEMWRVASRAVLFTLWCASTTREDEEIILSSRFLHRVYRREDALAAAALALGTRCDVTDQLVSPDIRAYIARKA